MNTVTYTFQCANCSRQFNAHEVSDFAYGQFVLRAEKSDYEAFLDAPNDPAFLESYAILEAHQVAAEMSAEQKGELQQRIFGVVCDPTPDGQQLEIGLPPKCPSCGSRKMANWQQVIPVQAWTLPLVSHERWTAMTERQKVELVVGRLRNSAPPKP
jgi:DNA-directed RNA polymerase subunit RPC12/RpoP